MSYVEIKIGDDVVKIEKVTKLWRGPIIVTVGGGDGVVVMLEVVGCWWSWGVGGRGVLVVVGC